MSLEFLSFHPVKREKSLVGFISFKWGKDFQFTEVPVHQVLNENKIRLLYLPNARPKGNVYNDILKEVNSYIVAQYPQVLK